MAALTFNTLQLLHFRSHARSGIELDGRPVAIFGPNGAGKTNVLEAVSLLSPGRGLRRAASEELVRQPNGPGWKIKAELTSLAQAHEIDTFAETGSPRQLRIDGKTATQMALGRIARIVWLVPSMDRLWIEAAEGRRRFLDRMTLSFEPGHGEAVLSYEKAMRERNRLLKDQIRDAHWYHALEARMGEAGAKIQTARRAAIDRISVAQADAETGFPAADLDLSAPDGAEFPEVSDELTDALAQNRMVDMSAGRCLIGPHRVDLSARYQAKDVAAAQCSTGEQKALLISLILSNARALREDFGAPPIVLLDEVAAHLDPSRRTALYDEICALGAQAWMTGTEQELFVDLGARAQYFRTVEGDSGSVILETEPLP